MKDRIKVSKQQRKSASPFFWEQGGANGEDNTTRKPKNMETNKHEKMKH